MSRTREECEKQVAAISARAVTMVDPGELKQKLFDTQKLRVKLGCDPTRPDLHFGHLVVLRKLRELQDLGHTILLIIGDFTGMIGDPTGRTKGRDPLSLEATRENGATYLAQAANILDTSPSQLQTSFNSDWLSTLNFEDIIRLSSHYTVARMLERNDFSNRFTNSTPIGIHEFMYPLAQAYDSVHLRADLELGGTDQTFNLLIGRDIQRAYGLLPQCVLTMPLLVGLDGTEKMSKSLGNYNHSDTPGHGSVRSQAGAVASVAIQPRSLYTGNSTHPRRKQGSSRGG